ncbi:hypothetical protein EsH8_VI_001084 [Colletotrichum jinshuiense]
MYPDVSIWESGPLLSGEETQNLCRVIRRSRRAFAAINKSAPSLLRMILPLCLKSPSIRHGLLSLGSSLSDRSPTDLYHYQMALSQLRDEINAAKANNLDIEWIHQLLASSLILSMFTLGQCDGCSVQHVRGMVGIVRMADQTLLASTPLGRFLMGASAWQDISAFWLGRKQPSQKAWTSWMAHRVSAKAAGELTALETMTGYPESLVTIIADIAEFVDDNVHMAMHQSFSHDGQPTSLFSPQSAIVGQGASDDLETSLKQWAMPSPPSELSSLGKLALRTAWETIRMAAFLYLWTSFGFHANVLDPIRTDRQTLRDAYVAEIISNSQAIIELSSQQEITIGNALLWPLVTAGCGCSAGQNQHEQAILNLLYDLERLYTMEHTKVIRKLLQRLWKSRTSSLNRQQTFNSSGRPYISMHQIVTEMNKIVPLL